MAFQTPFRSRSFKTHQESKGSTSLGTVNLVKMVRITEVPTLSIVLNLLYRMQQKFRRSTVKKGRITLERNPMVDIVSPWSISQLRSRVIRPFLTVDRRNFCCIRQSRFRTIERVGTSVILTIKKNLQLLGRCSLLIFQRFMVLEYRECMIVTPKILLQGSAQKCYN